MEEWKSFGVSLGSSRTRVSSESSRTRVSSRSEKSGSVASESVSGTEGWRGVEEMCGRVLRGTEKSVGEKNSGEKASCAGVLEVVGVEADEKEREIDG